MEVCPDSEEKYSLRGTPGRAANRAEKTQRPILDANISINSYPSYKHIASTPLSVQNENNADIALYGLAVEDGFQVGAGVDNPYVAIVGGNIASVYQYEHKKLGHVQTITDLDQEEIYYTCVWTKFREPNALRLQYAGERVLIFGGRLGILVVYSVNRKTVIHRATAHHGEINDLAVHPVYPNIVATASSDDSVHLYNVQEDLIQLASLEMQDMSSPVQSVCFNASGDKLVSGDMAHQITIWKMEVSEIKALDYKARVSMKAIKKNKQTFSECGYVKYYTIPEFVTCVAGTNYIDCIQVIGNNLILCKNASTNAITMWYPNYPGTKNDEAMYSSSLRDDNINRITELEVDSELYWWDRFAHDPSCRYVVCGLEDGVVCLWDLLNLKGLTVPHVKYRVPIEHRKGNKQCHIRQVAFSPNSKYLFALDSTNQAIHIFHSRDSKNKVKK